MKKIIILCTLLLLPFLLNPLFSQDKFRVLASSTPLHFGDFYLTGNGPGQIILNPSNPMGSSYYGVEYHNKSTISPYIFQIEKLVNEKVTIIYEIQKQSYTLQSIGYRPSGVDRDGGWNHTISTAANSQVLAVEASMPFYMGVSDSKKYITFGVGRGIITFKIGATLNVPANSPGDGLFYKTWSTFLFNYYVNWMVIE